MDIIHALILSVVEGITEFLPVSSTGHLILSSHILKIEQTDFLKSFEIIIQLGAILGIVFLYFRNLVKNINIWKRILAAYIPTAVAGLIFYKTVKNYLLGNENVVLIALFTGGIAIILLEIIHKEKDHHLENIEEVSLKNSFLIGVFQSISIIPGVSRAASTIVGGLFLGLKRKTAAEFSFLLAVPTMFSATVLDLTKTNFSFSANEYSFIAVGFLGSFVFSVITVKFFIEYIKNHNFVPFGVYRILLAAAYWYLLLR